MWIKNQKIAQELQIICGSYHTCMACPLKDYCNYEKSDILASEESVSYKILVGLHDICSTRECAVCPMRSYSNQCRMWVDYEPKYWYIANIARLREILERGDEND